MRVEVSLLRKSEHSTLRLIFRHVNYGRINQRGRFQGGAVFLASSLRRADMARDASSPSDALLALQTA